MTLTEEDDSRRRSIDEDDDFDDLSLDDTEVDAEDKMNL